MFNILRHNAHVLTKITSFFSRYAIAIVLLLFIGLGATYAIVTPLFEVSDEVWHYPMVKTLADGNGLPIQDPANVGPWRQEGSQPPLYYAVMALATFWIDTSDLEQVRWINPHTDNGVITPDRNNNILIHTYREEWPWRGTTLAVRLIRFLSVLLSAVTVYCAYRLALEIAPEAHGRAVATAAFVAFTPMFIFISASVNNDTLAITLAAAALWQMARWIRQGELPSYRAIIVMGLLLGGGALSKQLPLGLWPLAGAALCYAHFNAAGVFNQRTELISTLRRIVVDKTLWTRIIVLFGVAAFVCGWWYARNYILYGDWLGWNRFIAIVGARPTPATLAQLWGEREGFMQAYWGLFGGVSVPMETRFYEACYGVMAGGLVGLGIGFIFALIYRRINRVSVVHYLLLFAWIGLITLGLLRWTSQTWASQGRLVFPAITAISYLLITGLEHFIFMHSLRGLAVILLFGLSVQLPFTTIAPHYRPPPELTEREISRVPNTVKADFGGEMRLLGYALNSKTFAPGEALHLTLYWESQIAMDRNWSIFVHLVDEEGVIAAQRDRYPGQGLLATTLLRPGQTFADAYVIPIPKVAYVPSSARLEVGLYDLTTGERLPLAGSGHDALTLTTIALDREPEQTPFGPLYNVINQNFNNEIELAAYTMSQRSLRPGETLTVTLYWKGSAPITTNYSVFAHVRGVGETLWAGRDAWPQNGAAPTSTWRVGAWIEDPYALTLQPDTPPGLYDVEIGLYNADLKRLRVMNAERLPTDADFIFLSKIRVLP